MSLASWKEEFYGTPADRVSKKYALKHSLKKWIGLSPENTRKHEVFLSSGILYDDRTANELWIDGSSCALCIHFDGECGDCPIFQTTGRTCHGEYSNMIREGKTSPMVRLLRKTLELQGTVSEIQKFLKE